MKILTIWYEVEKSGAREEMVCRIMNIKFVFLVI